MSNIIIKFFFCILNSIFFKPVKFRLSSPTKSSLNIIGNKVFSKPSVIFKLVSIFSHFLFESFIFFLFSFIKKFHKSRFFNTLHIFMKIHISIFRLSKFIMTRINKQSVTLHHSKHSSILHSMFTSTLSTISPLINSTTNFSQVILNIVKTSLFIVVYYIHILNNSTSKSRTLIAIHMSHIVYNTTTIHLKTFNRFFFSKEFSSHRF